MFIIIQFAVPVSDELSISSGSSSHGTSRTPSPSSSTYSSFTNSGTLSAAAPPETYSRKVFVGGLPPDIDQGIGMIAKINCLLVLCLLIVSTLCRLKLVVFH